MNFKDFKKKSASLSETVSNMAAQPNNSWQDDRFWSMTKDTVGNSVAVIRFLPQQDFSLSPFQLTFRHSFQTAGKWFIDDCPVTIGENCPICEHSSSIWNSDEKEARKIYRKKAYIANILVISDPANPENDGHVFLFKFGKSIFDMIMEVVAPEDEDETGVNVFDFDDGLNFKLKMVQKSGYNNYDKSKFLPDLAPIAGGDEGKQEEIFKLILPFDEFIDKNKFKSYNELLQKFSNFSNSNNITASIEEDINNGAKQTPASELIAAEEFNEKVQEIQETDDEFDFDALLADN